MGPVPPPPRGGGPPPDAPRGRPPAEPGRPGRRLTFEEKVASDIQYCRQRLRLLRERFTKRQELLAQLETAKEEQAARYAQKYAAEMAGQQRARQDEAQQQQRQQQPGSGPG